MANWVTIENNEITGYYDLLPSSWGAISGLDKSAADLPFLKSLGWFPVVRQDIAYDSNTQQITSYQYTIQQDSVTETPVLTDLPVAQVQPTAYQDSFEYAKSQFMAKLRAIRDEKLAKSDISQLADVQATLDDTTKNAWITYRQALRDLPAKYVDNDILSIENVTWPEV